MTHEVLFPKPVPAAFQEDLECKMFYISESIRGFNLLLGAPGITGVNLEIPDDAAAPAIAAKVLEACETYRGRLPRPRPAQAWSNSVKRRYNSRTFEEMSHRGLAFQVGQGLVAVGEEFMALTDYIDASIMAVVKDLFAAKEYRYPTLISSDVMRRGGYLRSFPQLMMFVARLHSDYDVYKSAMDDGVDYMQHCREVSLCLPPTMCYHTYSQLADATFVAEPGCVITSKGKSFRFESRRERNLERLWDFTIREIVFLGGAAFVAEGRERLMGEAFRLMESWGLAGYCETANDPFFVESADGSDAFAQRLMALKYELRINISEVKTIAAASFNLHNDFFGEAFNIRYPSGDAVRTACAGFGLERLAFAFLCQHGLDPQGWPPVSRNILAKGKTSDDDLQAAT
jgi:seryl-tRNA synthetase